MIGEIKSRMLKVWKIKSRNAISGLHPRAGADPDFKFDFGKALL